ncbi:MAG: ABC transporter substrate-binding protein [Alphaproteobacteria bacterium]
MAKKLTVSMSACDYDRTRAIFDGKVGIDGCEVVPVAMPPEECFHRAFRYQEFDITELSMSSYMAQQAGAGSPYIAIPAFVSRMFRHNSVYIRTDRGIEKPEDLKGKIVGVPEYQMTAALWIRGFLQDDFGVRASDMRWRSGGLEQGGRKQIVGLSLPPEIELKSIPAEETLAGQLDQGKIDALVTARAPSCFGRNPKVVRLFPDYRPVEEDYFRRTGFFPIMHLIAIRRSLVEQHPWLPVNVLIAFMKAKQICYENLAKVGHLFTTLPWPVEEFEKAKQLMGGDYWRYGVKENAAEIEAMCRYAVEQGHFAKKLTAEDLFAPSTFELLKV